MQQNFFNRTDEIKHMNATFEILKQDIPVQLLMTGYRGVGKTSLIKKFLSDQPDNILTVHIDLSKICAENRNEVKEERIIAELYRELVQNIDPYEDLYITLEYSIRRFIKNPLESCSVNPFNLEPKTIKQNYLQLSRLTMKLPQIIVDKSKKYDAAIIVFDEFPLLGLLENCEEFLRLIKTNSSDMANVGYIFAGSVLYQTEMVELINGRDGIFECRMLHHNLNTFSEETIEKYLSESMADLKLTQKGFERFCEITLGIPAYINGLAAVLPRNEECDTSTVDEIFSENITRFSPWAEVWKILLPIEREITEFIAKNKKVRIQTLERKFQNRKTDISNHMNFLMSNSLIGRTSREYFISDLMLERWLEEKSE